MWSLHALAPSEWPALADFIHAHNHRDDGRARCLHAEQGDTPQILAEELRLLPAGEACFVAAHEAGELRGIAGAEFAADGRRAWVRGPLTDGGADAAVLRVALLAALHDALPEAERFDAFPQVDETPLRASLREAGYRDQAQHHVMERVATPLAPDWPAAVRDAAAHESAELAALHDALFPGTYLSGAALCASPDTEHRLFVAETPGTGGFGGYLYVQHRPHENEAYVDFVGVVPAARGHGLGRALLAAALHWAFVQRRLPRVCLTVRQDRAPALGLYQSAGFREVAAGAQMTFERPAQEVLLRSP